LSGKEEVLIVLRDVVFLLDVLGPLEEEDKAVDVGLYSVNEIVVI